MDNHYTTAGFLKQNAELHFKAFHFSLYSRAVVILSVFLLRLFQYIVTQYFRAVVLNQWPP